MLPEQVIWPTKGNGLRPAVSEDTTRIAARGGGEVSLGAATSLARLALERAGMVRPLWQELQARYSTDSHAGRERAQ